jgi:hypothetical protein
MMQLMERGPEQWRKQKVRITRDGDVYTRLRDWRTGALVTKHYRFTGRGALEFVWWSNSSVPRFLSEIARSYTVSTTTIPKPYEDGYGMSFPSRSKIGQSHDTGLHSINQSIDEGLIHHAERSQRDKWAGVSGTCPW